MKIHDHGIGFDVEKAFEKLKMDKSLKGFGLEELETEIRPATEALAHRPGDIDKTEDSIKRRLRVLKNFKIFGKEATNWAELMYPCLSIRCKKLTTKQLNIIATAVLRELQNLRLESKIPPYINLLN